jgi:Predicted periplasmic ligand-binding sensor domain
MNIKTLLPALSFSLISAITTQAQDRPIGQWRAHLPYNKAVGVASDGNTAFVATQESFFTYNVAEGEMTSYSKVDGMSDVGMSCIGYDATTGYVILGYSNSNIDLFKVQSFFNIPDLKIKSVAGSKKINNIYTNDGLAYLSTDIGIVVINIEKKEVKETYTFTRNSQMMPVNAVTIDGDKIYAATPNGVYSADKNSITLQDFKTWQVIDNSRNLISIASKDGAIVAAAVDTVYSIVNNQLNFIYKSDSSARHLDAGRTGIWLTENYKTYTGGVKKILPDYSIGTTFTTSGYGAQTTELPNGKVWIADQFNGFTEWGATGPTDYGMDKPDGPSAATTYDVFVDNKDLWVAHGGYTEKWTPLGSGSGFSNLSNDKWKLHESGKNPGIPDSIRDISRILKGSDGTIYAASFGKGLFVMNTDGSTEVYGSNSGLEGSVTGSGILASGLALDNSGNLWMTLFGSNNELVVKTTDKKIYKYTIPISRPIAHAAANVIIDDNGQKWFAGPLNGGVGVYSDNGTFETSFDDNFTVLFSGKGNGGLPDNDVLCLAKDKSGAIWIGTSNGIGIVNCPGSVLSGQCEAELRVVQYDDFAGHLFQNEQVRAIAVDGGNRKWIGTNNGVWLVSPDGDKIISRFTEENSPLFSNIINKITIDNTTGDVYIGTDKGLMSYRGTATEGLPENADKLVTYPNPVPSDYTGPIAIKGLVENADVRITDVGGQLVYRTTANGGQAMWNGKDYTGHRPQSGVYLIFVTNRDGSQTHTGKLVFMR